MLEVLPTAAAAADSPWPHLLLLLQARLRRALHLRPNPVHDQRPDGLCRQRCGAHDRGWSRCDQALPVRAPSTLPPGAAPRHCPHPPTTPPPPDTSR